MKFYVTFGLGSVLGGNYMVAYAPNEDVLRIRLCADRLPWAFIYTPGRFGDMAERYGLQELARHYEAPTEHHSGPCPKRDEVAA